MILSPTDQNSRFSALIFSQADEMPTGTLLVILPIFFSLPLRRYRKKWFTKRASCYANENQFINKVFKSEQQFILTCLILIISISTYCPHLLTQDGRFNRLKHSMVLLRIEISHYNADSCSYFIHLSFLTVPFPHVGFPDTSPRMNVSITSFWIFSMHRPYLVLGTLQIDVLSFPYQYDWWEKLPMMTGKIKFPKHKH